MMLGRWVFLSVCTIIQYSKHSSSLLTTTEGEKTSKSKCFQEGEDLSDSEFLVCVHWYSVLVIHFNSQTFIFLIDSHRIGENKQSRMNALDLRQVHTYVFGANFGTLHLSPSLSCYCSIGRSLFRSISTWKWRSLRQQCLFNWSGPDSHFRNQKEVRIGLSRVDDLLQSWC